MIGCTTGLEQLGEEWPSSGSVATADDTLGTVLRGKLFVALKAGFFATGTPGKMLIT